MRRWTLALLAVVLVASACGGGDDESPASAPSGGDGVDTEIVLSFDDGELVGGVRREDASLGDAVRVTIEGGVAEQVHVHGYDLYIEPDGEQTLDFDALIPGRFEIELEQSGRLLVELTVS